MGEHGTTNVQSCVGHFLRACAKVLTAKTHMQETCWLKVEVHIRILRERASTDEKLYFFFREYLNFAAEERLLNFAAEEGLDPLQLHALRFCIVQLALKLAEEEDLGKQHILQRDLEIYRVKNADMADEIEYVVCKALGV